MKSLEMLTQLNMTVLMRNSESFPGIQKYHGLFSGGQFNGSSGYEEAASQGLIAGINAAMSILHRDPLTWIVPKAISEY